MAKKKTYWSNRQRTKESIEEEIINKKVKEAYLKAYDDITRKLESKSGDFTRMHNNMQEGIQLFNKYTYLNDKQGYIMQRIYELGLEEQDVLRKGFYYSYTGWDYFKGYDEEVLSSARVYENEISKIPIGEPYFGPKKQEKYIKAAKEKLNNSYLKPNTSEDQVVMGWQLSPQQLVTKIDYTKDYYNQILSSKKLSKGEIESYYKWFESAINRDTIPQLEQDHAVEQVIDKVWASDGKHWSDRIWADKSKLSDALSEGLLQIEIQGASKDDLIRALTADKDDYNRIEDFDNPSFNEILEKNLKLSYNNAERLVRTELSYVENQAAAQRYQDMGFDKYEFIAYSNSGRTCEVCEELNGKTFRFSDMEVGVNAPPMHPNCRCTISPVVRAEDGSSYNKQNTKKAEAYKDVLATGVDLKPVKKVDRTTGKILESYKNAQDAEFKNKYPEDSVRNILKDRKPTQGTKWFDDNHPRHYTWVDENGVHNTLWDRMTEKEKEWFMEEELKKKKRKKK